MQSGDQYTYEVIFQPRGVKEVINSRIALNFYEEAMRDAAKSADEFSRSSGRFGKAAVGMRDSTSRAAMGMTQLTYVLDDMQYGVRGLMNQIPMISTALFGFGLAGAAAGAVGTVLAGVFRDQIDAGLEWAGVLDENVVKGMRRASGELQEMTDRLADLQKAFEQSDKPTRERAAAIAQAFADSGKEAERSMAQVVAAMGVGEDEYERGIQSLERKIADLEQRRNETIRTAGASAGAAVAILNKEIENAKFELVAYDQIFNEKLFEDGLKGLKSLQEEAAKSDAALEKLAEIARDSGHKELAKALSDATKAGKAFAEQEKENERLLKEHEREEERRAKEAERRHQQELERKKREAEAAEEAARRQMAAIEAARKAADDRDRDEATQRVIDALGGRFDAGISTALQNRVMAGQGLGQVGVGGATDDVALQVVQQLTRAGVGIDSARQAARELVEEQAAAIRAITDTNNLNFRLNQQMLDGFASLKQQQEQMRQNLIQLMQQSARKSGRMRGNMQGTYRPF